MTEVVLLRTCAVHTVKEVSFIVTAGGLVRAE
jgi:hypothetical protein